MVIGALSLPSAMSGRAGGFASSVRVLRLVGVGWRRCENCAEHEHAERGETNMAKQRLAPKTGPFGPVHKFKLFRQRERDNAAIGGGPLPQSQPPLTSTPSAIRPNETARPRQDRSEMACSDRIGAARRVEKAEYQRRDGVHDAPF